MSNQTLLNGVEPSKEELLSLLNSKEILRGKSPFTTLLINKGKIPFWDRHHERLKKTFSYLYKDLDFSNFEKKLEKARKIGVKEKSQISSMRLTMIRSEDEIDLLTQIEEYKKNEPIALRLKTCLHPLRSSSLPKFIKNGNYLEISLEVLKAAQLNLDDCLFLDSEGHAAECSTSNIFFRKGSRFFTPSLEGPVLDGITRSVVLDILKDLGQAVEEINISRPEWENMDEAFITSSLRGLVSVSEIDGRSFSEESDFLAQIKKDYEGRLL
ncbi:MAG: branched-subunit amino acid aminotransferase/4-amino-4-deoxychorismate lyase [Bacteriovoracaceae bacterium]|jgi:branched-subunit amino acid aminotransferase/4-amino-4-deoxychorismate lyase